MLSAMILAFASGVHCRRSRPAGITSIGRARPFPLLSKPLSNVVTSPITRYAPDSAGPQHSNLKTFENVGVTYRLPLLGRGMGVRYVRRTQGGSLRLARATRSEARRVGKEGVRTCGYWWSPDHSKKKKK